MSGRPYAMRNHNEIRANHLLRDLGACPDFEPTRVPKANGKEAPSAISIQPNDSIVLEFLSIYYVLNCRYAKLIEARRLESSPVRQRQERRALRAIEQALRIRDSLEDRYAPYGVSAEAQQHDGFTININFTFGNVDASGRRRGEPHMSSACLTFPLPPGVEMGPLTTRLPSSLPF